MLYITYESKNGRLDFNGGSMNRPWRVLEIEGLGLTGKSFNTAAYPASIGQQTLSETIEARTISIQCDVNCICSYYGAGRSPGWEVSKALKVLNEPGNLIIRNGHRMRKIEARCVEAVQSDICLGTAYPPIVGIATFKRWKRKFVEQVAKNMGYV